LICTRQCRRYVHSVRRRPVTDSFAASRAADVDESGTPCPPCRRLHRRRRRSTAAADAAWRPADVAVRAAADGPRSSSRTIGSCGPAARATAGARRERPPAVDVAGTAAAAEDEDTGGPGDAVAEPWCSMWWRRPLAASHCSERWLSSSPSRRISADVTASSHITIAAVYRAGQPPNCPSPFRYLDPIKYMVPWANPSHPPKRHLDRSNRFAGLTNVTNRPTHRTRYSVCSSRPHLAIATMRPKKGAKYTNESVTISLRDGVIFNDRNSFTVELVGERILKFSGNSFHIEF